LEERWAIALTMTCDLFGCLRKPGERCVNSVDGRPRDEPHWNRVSRGQRKTDGTL
jgi:hypothetical protein